MSDHALADPLYWLIVVHLAGGMYFLLPWPRKWKPLGMWVWLGTAAIMVVLLLSGVVA